MLLLHPLSLAELALSQRWVVPDPSECDWLSAESLRCDELENNMGDSQVALVASERPAADIGRCYMIVAPPVIIPKVFDDDIGVMTPPQEGDMDPRKMIGRISRKGGG